MFIVYEFLFDVVLVFVGFDVVEGYLFSLGGYFVIVRCEFVGGLREVVK